MNNYNKSFGALAAGAVCTLIVGGLSMGGIHFPDSMTNAVQTLLTIGAVFFIPHGGDDAS